MASRSIDAWIVDEVPSPAPAAPLNSTATLSARLAPLAETARDYARAATSANTTRAYSADWRHYSSLARRQNLARPAPGSPGPRALHRRLRLRRGRPAAVLGQHDRAAAVGAHVEFRPTRPADGPQGPAVATVLAGVRRTQGRPPDRKRLCCPSTSFA